jgi:glyoxalase family protein
VTVTSFSVPAGSLEVWRTRLTAHGLTVRPTTARFGEQAMLVTDPSGLAMELVASDRDDRQAWSGGDLDPAYAIRGLHSVTLTIRHPEKTLDFMTGLLGVRIVAEENGRTRVAAGGDAPGHFAEILHDPHAPAAVNGLGTVHHVAYAIATAEEQLALREDLLRQGHHVTEVRDRQYFLSIYFREPGGVLFEVATIKPGFLVDEPLDALGRSLKLPPWEEPDRADIEAGLPAIRQ